MANLSERLNTLADALADGRFNDNEDDAWTCYEAKTLIDRLTVEGLAGVLAKATCGDLPTADDRTIAQALIDYINTPSVEESHGDA